MNKLMTRRQVLATASILLAPSYFNLWDKRSSYEYCLAKVTGQNAILPPEKYIPFDWAVAELPLGPTGVKLSWDQASAHKKSQAKLRITSATDVREVLIVEVKTALTGKKIADWDLRFAAYMQPFDLEIAPEDINAMLAEGVTLSRTTGSKAFWFFSANDSPKTAPSAFLPHLLVYQPSPRKDAWQERLLSLESVQAFGWMQGVVWDGLLEMSKHSKRAKSILSQQLNLFFGQNSLVYANLNNLKTVEKISTVESILPFAILAQTHPEHPLLQTAIAFCEAHANAEGVIADGTGNNRMVKTEECYTVSYPLAVLAKTLKRPELAQLAIQTLQSRINILDQGEYIFQRSTEQGEAFFGNWSRGVAWYLLGLAKTLVHLPPSEQKRAIQLSFQSAVEKVIAFQQPNGLWFNFFHQPETGIETSGTAGIAAALTYGYQNGLLAENAKAAAIKAQNGLLPFLTPDGYLTGTAQVNKGGDALQKNGFRVISPYTLGFLAHLNWKLK